MAQIPWVQITESVIGRGHPTLADVANRALRLILSLTGYNPDGIFSGLFGPVYNVKAFGAVGDGIADDTAAIQNTIDAAIAAKAALVFIPDGMYKTSDVIHVGYGVTYTGLTVMGSGSRYRGDETANPGNMIGGAIILPTFSDRPCINVQGARSTVLRGFGIKGQLYTWINTKNLGFSSPLPLVDDTVAANWQDPSLAATQESRYAPYAGVSIDAYSGAMPGAHYPTVNYPASLGAVGQYNKNFSSNVTLEDMYICGFNVGVVNQPCDADGNGDFTHLQRVYFEMCKWGVSAGNSQARNTALTDCVMLNMFCAITNNVHGRQMGKFGSVIKDLSCARVVQLIQFGSFYALPMTFLNCYAEDIWKLGSYLSLSGQESSLIFQACEFSWSLQNDTRGYPAWLLDGGQQQIDVKFIGGIWNQYNNQSVMGINQVGVTFDNLTIRRDTNRAQTYQQLANNAMAGGLFLPTLTAPDYCSIHFSAWNLDTGARDPVSFSTKTCKKSSRVTCIPWYCEKLSAVNEQGTNMGVPPRESLNTAFSKAGFTSVSLVGPTLTLVFAARTDAQFMQYGPLPGDVLIDDQTGSVFFVRSRTTTTVLAELQNNYKVVGGVVTPLVAFSTTVGNFYYRNSRIYTPTWYTRGDLTAATATITNVGRDDGGTGHVTTDIIANDALLIPTTNDFFMSTSNAVITVVAATQLTMTGSVARSQTLKQLKWFIRQAPANV